MNYLVSYSVGAGSWGALMRLIDRGVDPAKITLLFADTKMEDEDSYRFLDDTTAKLGCRLIRIADGRDVWEVFADERYIGNSRIDPCSKILKRELMNRWRDQHCDPATTILVYGLSWDERGRIEGRNGKPGLRARVEAAGWRVEFPLNERPYLVKADILAQMTAHGITPPRLYGLGFPHNNCGGFCVKAGLGQFRHLLKIMPERYRYHEEREAATMASIGPAARPFLKLRNGGVTRYVTMRQFREMLVDEPNLGKSHGWGCGGGCAVDDANTDTETPQ